MAIAGKMEILIKINEMPKEVKTVKDGWKEFAIEVGSGRTIGITVRPKMFKKLEEAQEKYPQWVATISGKMGQASSLGFLLEEPNIQVFEKKAKGSEEGQEEAKTTSI
jgi:hypothetical protein